MINMGKKVSKLEDHQEEVDLISSTCSKENSLQVLVKENQD
jgi:hypothetical protein